MKVDLFIAVTFEESLEVVQRPEARLLEFAEPALVDVLQRHRIEEMELFPPAPDGGDQVGGLEDSQVLSDGLTGHIQVPAKVTERPSVVAIQEIEKLAPAGIGQRLEQEVGIVHSSAE